MKLSPPHSAFREAEALQHERQPQYPLLYSVPGYRYCDLLLESPEPADESPEQAIARIREVRNRAETALEIVLAGSQSLLDIGLNRLTLGRTYLAEAELRKSEIEQAEQHLNQSVSLLRQAGQQQELPRGLLHRAVLWRAFEEGETRRVGDGEKEYFERAERDLAEMESIAERGSMLIWQIEAALERCRLFLVLAQTQREGETPAEPQAPSNDQTGGLAGASPSLWLERAQHKLDEVRRLVKETERPYEPHVPDWDDWEPPEYVGLFQKGDIVGYHCRNDEIERLEQELRRQ